MRTTQDINVLIACEESQRVCIAFRERGFNAFSCDIQECSGGHPEWHILGDCFLVMKQDVEFATMDGTNHNVSHWDLIIAHPPCTYLSNAGNRWYNVDRYGDKAIDRWIMRKEAVEFFYRFFYAPASHIVIENPIGYINKYLKPTQIIQPYYFCDSIDSEDYVSKTTCLWYCDDTPNKLPVLQRTNGFPKPSPIKKYSNGKKASWTEEQHDAKTRSKTFVSVANAMAEQWGKWLIDEEK